eukprot:TRINITY_DN11558_c0_g3_i4.p1 TRINITY_DN11558_c0_g3~~TRINITY_DN11558_c0_g3_i4.p1  ORF type:complete len:101 (-),score=21.53 TRINITY_DN11558_c0_g3_i4:86-388(-)
MCIRDRSNAFPEEFHVDAQRLRHRQIHERKRFTSQANVSKSLKDRITYVIPVSIITQMVGIYYMAAGEKIGRWYGLVGTWLTSSFSVCPILTKIATGEIL